MKKLLLLMLFITGACFATPEIPAGATSYLPLNGNLTDLLGTVWTGSPSFTPGKFGDSLVKYLPASNLSYPQFGTNNVDAFNVGWQDFTYEFWIGIDVNLLGYTTVQRLASLYLTEASQTKSHGLELFWGTIDAPNNRYSLNLRAWDGSTYNASGFGGYATNTAGIEWYHICFERKNTGSALTIYFYINGHLIGAGTMNTPVAPLKAVSFSLSGTAAASATAYVDDFTFSRGIAKYGGVDFIPPGSYRNKGLALSQPVVRDIVDANTVSLFHFDSDFTDLVPDATWLTSGAWYVTPPGNSNWTIEPTSAKFGDGGIYENIDTPYNWGVLTSEMPSKFWFGSGDFTLEWWLRVDSITSYVGTVNLLDFFAQNDASNYWQFYSRITPSSTSNYSIYTGAATLSGGSWVDLRQSGGISKTIGDWTHFACVRNGGTMTLYMDGVAVSSFSSATAGYIFNMTNAANISLQRVWNPNRFRGEISVDEFRASNIARYTSNFTPPTAPFGTTTMRNAYSFSDILRLLTRLPDSDTISLFHFDGAGDELNDIGAASWTMEQKDAYADVTIDTNNGKFAGALYDGTGTSPDAWWMRTADVDDFKAIGTGDYSLEFWIRANANINYLSNFNFFYINVLGMPTGTCRLINMFFLNTDGFTTLFGCNPYHGGEQLAISAQPMNTWTHICLEKYGGTTTIYVNGVAHYSGSAGMSAINFATMTGIEIGHNSSSGAGVSGNWLIDELKITKKAVYMGNFTPPTLPYYYYGTNKLGLGE